MIGGTASGDDLTIESTSASTKGDIILQPNGGNVGIGTSTPSRILTIADTVEITAGGLMFPDGTVQTSASTSTTDSTYWERLDGNTLGLSTDDNVRINVPTDNPAYSIFNNSDVLFGVHSEAYTSGSVVVGVPFWAMCNIDYQYDPSALGPNIRLLNRGTQTNSGSSMGTRRSKANMRGEMLVRSVMAKILGGSTLAWAAPSWAAATPAAVRVMLPLASMAK